MACERIFGLETRLPSFRLTDNDIGRHGNKVFDQGPQKAGVTVTPGVGRFQVKLGLMKTRSPGRIIFSTPTQLSASEIFCRSSSGGPSCPIKTRLTFTPELYKLRPLQKGLY
jgi:hypothetical protein